MQLPTTNGSEVATALSTRSFSLGSTAGLTLPSTAKDQVLYTAKNLNNGQKSPKARAGYIEGYAISITASANVTLVVSATIEFTEELETSVR
jgi:hypothetical protein